MKTNKWMWFVVGALLVLAGLLGAFVQKKFAKPVIVQVVDTFYIDRVDTIIKTVYLKRPKPDTFYVQEILIDSVWVYPDTASILRDYNGIYEYNDTLVNDTIVTLTLAEKTQYNKIFDRKITYEVVSPIYTTLPVPMKPRARLYAGAELGAGMDGLTTAAVGVGLKTKKDQFFLVNNNFAYGLKVNIGVGTYLPITR